MIVVFLSPTEGFMHAKDVLAATYATSERIMDRYLDGLSDADLLVRPVAGQNHIAWQLGHLIIAERMMVEGIKPGSSPPLPAGFEEAHGRDEASTRSDDPTRFLSKEKYLALFKAQRDATKEVLKSLTDAELDGPGPERFRQLAPTAGATLLLAGTHVLMHVGQFVGVRRKLNKPVAI
jgi:hypothetical protein